ncbi:YwqI/YxiC family protein [Metabacillus sp. GX 13764]|uniref:YwqI/YxiC family protein n=1 Tax=Metabacillus kandeliae TaxID=2900151 RepID=UPI001E3FEBC5|nr:YwqI/YxiC family protein [Metabacillus kandeliae]MCD7035551.1 YwqI/YxiC family protein [Metabacillus kandeliae]
MPEIKLNHAEVTGQLNNMKNALNALKLPSPSESAIGQNMLDFTEAWLDREENIHQLLSMYITAVEKNIEDTQSNIDSLKKQDEAITAS